MDITKPLTIIGLVDQNVAAQSQRGFVELSGGNITIRNARLSNSTSGACLGIQGGNTYVIDGSSFVNCAQEGIAVHGDFGSPYGRVSGFTLTNSTITGANTAGTYDTGWEAGGIKVVSVDNVTISGNTINANTGPGIWLDGGGQTATISGNRVYSNTNAGIMVETQIGAAVTGNAVWENGWGNGDASAWAGWGACILNSSSQGVSVTGNTVAWCTAGVGVIEQARSDNPGSAAGDTVTSNYIAEDSGRYLIETYYELGAPHDWGAMAPNSAATAAQLQARGMPTAPQPGH